MRSGVHFSMNSNNLKCFWKPPAQELPVSAQQKSCLFLLWSCIAPGQLPFPLESEIISGRGIQNKTRNESFCLFIFEDQSNTIIRRLNCIDPRGHIWALSEGVMWTHFDVANWKTAFVPAFIVKPTEWETENQRSPFKMSLLDIQKDFLFFSFTLCKHKTLSVSESP